MTAQPLPPLPDLSNDYTEDEKYRGITIAMDKAIEALHRDGWTITRLYTRPNARLDLPPGKFPAGRVYLFSDNVAVVVNNHTGQVVTSLPATAALKTLNQYTPDVLAGDPWAGDRWARFLEQATPEQADVSPRWWKQSWFDRDGTIHTVRRTPGNTVKVYRDGMFACELGSADEADSLGLPLVTVEMVAYLTSTS